jgi:hypothetical protein
MSFSDRIRQREAEKRRVESAVRNWVPAWWQATAELCKFVQHHLYTHLPLLVSSHPIQVDGYKFDWLTIAYEQTTASLTPLSLADPIAPKDGGCAVLAAGSLAYHLLWDGTGHSAPHHWRIVRATQESAAPQALSEETLDHALEELFGFANGSGHHQCKTCSDSLRGAG